MNHATLAPDCAGYSARPRRRHPGAGAQSESIAARFFNPWGAALLDRTDGATTGVEGLTQTLGGKMGIKVQLFAKSKLILIWASNAIAQGQRPTASGRCEFFRTSLAAGGQDGLTRHVPNPNAFNTSERDPLAMISPPARNFLNSRFVNVKSLRDIQGKPILEMHTNDAQSRGISPTPALCGCSALAAVTAAK